MTHLSDDVLLEMAETGKTHPHVADCDRCRRVFEDAREALTLARAEKVPEPSPLFWDHFSARVHEAVRGEGEGRPRSGVAWVALGGWRSVVAMALATLVVAGVVWRLWPAAGPARQAGRAQATAAAPGTGNPAVIDIQVSADAFLPASDPSWNVIVQVTAQMEITSATEAGLVFPPDASDRAISQLSPSEQQELVRLLQADLDGPSSE